MTKISVIIPVYNAEKYIVDTIKSVLAQTYINWELIIIDDGSIDESAKIITDFLKDNRITYHYQVNGGVSSARNRGLLFSKGDFIAFLDADDYWEDDNLMKKMEIFKDQPQVDWVFSDLYNADFALQRIGLAPTGTDVDILENILLWEREVIPGPCSNIIVRRRCLDGGIKFDPSLSTAADQDFTIQLASKFKGKRIPLPLVTYRVLSSSMSRNISVMERDHILVYNKASKARMFYSNSFERKCFSNMYLTLAGSWWVNGSNKVRGAYFGIRAALLYPPHILKILKKLLSR